MAGWKFDNLFHRQKIVLPKYFEKNNLGFGFYLISILCAVSGKWLNIRPFQIRRSSICFYLLQFYSYVTTVMFSFITCVTIIIVKDNFASDFSIILYLVCGFVGQIECSLRAYLMHFKKAKIEKFIVSLEKLINETQLKKFKLIIIPRLTKYITLLLIIFSMGYFLAMLSNYLAITDSLHNIVHGENVTKNSNLEVREFYYYSQTIRKFCPWFDISEHFYLIFILCMLSLTLVVATDVLFYSCYWLIVTELEILRKILGKIFDDQDEMKWWLKRHQALTRILLDLNAITSPIITMSVIFSTIQICFMTFTVVKQYHQELAATNIVSMLLFGSVSLLQLFIYCILGQKIREQIVKLQFESYRAPWLGAPNDAQHAVLMISSAATEHSMQLPGAPFFALSLDFFASVIGAIVTYFIILLQVK